MLIAFKKFIATHRLFDKRTPVLLAVSGGVDSVVLVHLFRQAGYNFGIAHCNFQLRGAASDGDERFVKALAEKYGVPFYSKRLDTAAVARKEKISTQMAARDLRYEWFEKVRKKEGYHFIATAHHLNDNVETVLLNLVKGTGIRGLHGILPKNDKLARPLLFAGREEIERYAKEKNLEYREDVSNLADDYERNYLRLNIIPLLQKLNPALITTFGSNIEIFRESERLYEQGLLYFKKKLIEQRGSEYFLPIKKLRLFDAGHTLLYELLRDFGFNNGQVQDVLNALDAEPGKQFLSPTHRLIKDRQFLIIQALEGRAGDTIVLIEENTGQKRVEGLRLKFKRAPADKITISDDPYKAFLDHDKLKFPLTLRRWKRGDYFYPLGMKKKKKLSDFFADKKLSLIEKENAWVLLSAQKVVWLPGYRIDERFKVTPATKNIYKISARTIKKP